MLTERLLVAAILLPIGMAAIYFGGLFYAVVVIIILVLAAVEFVQMFRAGGFAPAGVLVVGGALLLVVGRILGGFTSAPWMISLIILVSMAYHVLAYERGRDASATDFALTLAGVFYLGWLGGYFVSLRNLPEGTWWVLTVLSGVWLADTGAYFVGRRFGVHKFSPRTSPKKTWEGYVGGVLVGTLGATLFSFLWIALAGPGTQITPLRAAVIGLVLSVVTSLGDLGESMLKRQVGLKDSGKLLPGHGGMFDRIDSWLWGAVLGYYLVSLFLS
jgi:phosphatidate cytidylyltransferase